MPSSKANFDSIERKVYILVHTHETRTTRVHDHKLLIVPLKEGIRQMNALCFLRFTAGFKFSSKAVEWSLYCTVIHHPVAQGYRVR